MSTCFTCLLPHAFDLVSYASTFVEIEEMVGGARVTYSLVQRSHNVVMLADLRRCCEQYTANGHRMLLCQFDPLASNLRIRVGVV
jgi:hypothetical protein